MRALLITLAIASVAAQCDRWAAAGECTRNPEYMRVRCADECAQAANAAPPSPAPSPLLVYTKSACAAWAAAGECETNAAFMMHSCSAACEEATRQRPCSLQACSGLAEHACDADSMHVTAAASPTAPAPWHTLPQLANTPAPIAVINEAEVPARLLWVDGLGMHACECSPRRHSPHRCPRAFYGSMGSVWSMHSRGVDAWP